MKHRTLSLIATLGLTSLLACVPMDGGNGNGNGNGDQARTFTATLNGNQETPPVETDASGTGTFTLDVATNVMTFTVNFSGLSGAITVAHFHAAPAGQAGGVIIDLSGDFTGLTSGPVQGTATFNAANLAELNAGDVYINLHTDANPNGEIRGQLVESP
jgi:hypothetical protein